MLDLFQWLFFLFTSLAMSNDGDDEVALVAMASALSQHTKRSKVDTTSKDEYLFVNTFNKAALALLYESWQSPYSHLFIELCSKLNAEEASNPYLPAWAIPDPDVFMHYSWMSFIVVEKAKPHSIVGCSLIVPRNQFTVCEHVHCKF